MVLLSSIRWGYVFRLNRDETQKKVALEVPVGGLDTRRERR